MKILCLFGKHEYDVVSEKVLEDIYDYGKKVMISV